MKRYRRILAQYAYPESWVVKLQALWRTVFGGNQLNPWRRQS